MSKTYKYAVVPSCGMYGSGDVIRPAKESNDLDRAKKLAASLTAEYQASMRRFGYTSGGYRVVENRGSWMGHELDRATSL